MSIDVREAYIESEVLEADGCRLVQLMYHKALESVTKAREHLAAGRIEGRSREITRVSEIVNELALAVDHGSGGEMSRNLVEIYDYVQNRLQEANFRQTEAPLAEVERLLQTLLEGWEQCRASNRTLPVAETGRESVPVNCLG